MAKYTFNSQNTFTVNTDIGKISRKLSRVIERGVPKIGIQATRKIIMPIFTYEAKKFINEGGADSGVYAWGYWRRKKGGQFTYVDNKRSSWFSDRWSHRGKSEVRYPIHPRSYTKYRKERRVPRSNQYALYDTAKLYNNFYISAEFIQDKMSQTHIRNRYRRLDRHEEGNQVPQRMIIEPVSKRLEADMVLQGHIMDFVRDGIKKILEDNRK